MRPQLGDRKSTSSNWKSIDKNQSSLTTKSRCFSSDAHQCCQFFFIISFWIQFPSSWIIEAFLWNQSGCMSSSLRNYLKYFFPPHSESRAELHIDLWITSSFSWRLFFLVLWRNCSGWFSVVGNVLFLSGTFKNLFAFLWFYYNIHRYEFVFFFNVYCLGLIYLSVMRIEVQSILKNSSSLSFSICLFILISPLECLLNLFLSFSSPP